MRDFWGRKTVCLVTGASQNIGRALAEEISPKLGPGSLLILTSRSSEKLGLVRQTAYETNPGLRIQLIQWDLSKPDGRKYKEDLEDVLKVNEMDADEFQLALIVHNARTSGDQPRHVTDLIDEDFIQKHLNINLVSMLVANSAFWSVFGPAREKVLINMTGLPEKDHDLVSISTASRSIALNLLSSECPDIRVLHYSPGAVDSTMINTIVKSTHDPNVYQKIQELYEQNKVLKPKETVKALLEFLAENEIEPCMELDARQLQKTSRITEKL